MSLKQSSEEDHAMTREKPEALAARIAAVLHERRMIGEARRRREYQGRDAEPAVTRARGEAKRTGRLIKELDAMYESVISSNAADEAMKAHGEMDESEPVASPDSST